MSFVLFLSKLHKPLYCKIMLCHFTPLFSTNYKVNWPFCHITPLKCKENPTPQKVLDYKRPLFNCPINFTVNWIWYFLFLHRFCIAIDIPQTGNHRDNNSYCDHIKCPVIHLLSTIKLFKQQQKNDTLPHKSCLVCIGMLVTLGLCMCLSRRHC